MTKLVICFPGGAGGNWLSHLIHSLETNTFTESANLTSYHRHKKSRNVMLTHDYNNKSAIFFNGHFMFNIYLNVVKKLRIADENLLDSFSVKEYFEVLANEAASKLSFLGRQRDLSWDYLIAHPDRFIESLYSILDRYNFDYTKNDDICYSAMNEYRKTCVDPRDHFDNYNSLYWLGWCNGVCKHLWNDWPMVNSVEEMKDFLLPKHELLHAYTQQFVLAYQ